MSALTLAPLPPCPAWCDGDCTVRNAGTLSHDGPDQIVKLSKGAGYDNRHWLSFGLFGDLGGEPAVYMSDGNILAELTIDEAEEMAATLTSLIEQARG